MPTNVKSRRPAIRRETLLKAVASSTAVETDDSIKQIESRLKARRGRFKTLSLS